MIEFDGRVTKFFEEKGPTVWIRRNFARHMLGYGVDPVHEHACKFCIVGAIYNLYKVERWDRVIAATEITRRWEERGPTSHKHVTGFNDDPKRRFEEIVAACRQCNF